MLTPLLLLGLVALGHQDIGCRDRFGVNDQPGTLPPLSFASIPGLMSARTVEIHQGLHQGYRRAVSEHLRQRRWSGLAFALGGDLLHDNYFATLSPSPRPLSRGALSEHIEEDIGGLRQLQASFFELAGTVKGRGWVVLGWMPGRRRLVLLPVREHHMELPPGLVVLLSLDCWEHAWQRDHPPDRDGFSGYIRQWWPHIDWPVVEDLLLRA